jgi:hypothetical protein
MVELTYRALAAYALVSLPALCLAPAARIYVANGRRYDMGSVWGLAAGALMATAVSEEHARTAALVTFAGLLVLIPLRVFVLARGSSTQFTMLSLGAFWALPAVVREALVSADALGGVQARGTPEWPYLLLSAIAGCALIAWICDRRRLGIQLQAMTDSPSVYEVLFRSPWRVAIECELVTLAAGLGGGVLLWATANSIGADLFRIEGVWVVINAALASRLRWYAVPLVPLSVAVLRLALQQSVPPALTEVATYFALAFMVLIVQYLRQTAAVMRV